jgi:LPS-assembly lipoprotein
MHTPGCALRAATALALVGALASCGFHLRGDADFPFETIFVNAPSSPPMATELTRAIGAESKAKVVETAASAEVVLDVPIVVDDKDVLSLSSGGSVREYALVKRVAFRLHGKNGADWMPAGEIIVRRSYTFNETQVLARDLQEQRLLREMQTDAVQQIVRRLQTARKPV